MVFLHELFQIQNQHFHLRVYLPISKLSSLGLTSNLLHIPSSANFLQGGLSIELMYQNTNKSCQDHKLTPDSWSVETLT